MMLLWLALGCGSSEPATPAGPPADPNTPSDGDVLVVAFPSDPGNVSPLVAPYASSAMITDLVQPGLVRRQVTRNGLEYEPALAEKWSWNADGTVLTYTLREGLTWADGTPLTSKDVAFTQELIADPDVASNWLGTAKHIVSVQTPDPRTAVYTFDVPRNPVLQQGYTIRGVVPEHTLKSVDRGTFRGNASGRDPLASGPFRIAKWEPDNQIVLERNPAAPAEWRPHLDRIVIKVIPEPSTRLLELQNGTVDLLLDVDADNAGPLLHAAGITVEVEEAASMQYIGYNQTNPMFQDLLVRQALTESIDRDAMIANLFTVDGKPFGQPCVGTIAPTLGPWYADDLKPLPFDVADAKAHLDAAGWTDTDGDGVRSKNGVPLRFSLMVQTGESQLDKIAIYTQAAWKDVGVQLDIDRVEAARFAERARQKDYQAMLWGFGANPKVDPSQEWRSDGQYNWFGYTNPAVDAKIDEGVSAADPQVAQAAFREVQRLVHADQPVTFLFWSDKFLAMSDRFRDTEHNTFNGLLHAERWWVPSDQQKYKR